MSTHKSLTAGLAGAVVPTVNLVVFGLKLFAIDEVNANDAEVLVNTLNWVELLITPDNLFCIWL